MSGNKKKYVAGWFSIPLCAWISILKKKDVLAATSLTTEWKKTEMHHEHCLLQWFAQCQFHIILKKISRNF